MSQSACSSTICHNIGFYRKFQKKVQTKAESKVGDTPFCCCVFKNNCLVSSIYYIHIWDILTCTREPYSTTYRFNR